MESDRAAALHADSLVVDAHSDVFCDVEIRRARGETDVLRRFHLPAWQAGGVNAVVTALYVEPEHKPDRALRQAMRLLGAALNDIEQTPEVAFCRTRAEIDAAVARGQIAFILSIEGGECIQDGIEALRVFYELGVRLIGLTWNQRNMLAEGIGEARAGGGLTELGRTMVREANRLGILLDVSHLSVKSFWDLIETSQAPIIASHSNAKALCDHPRNLDDDQIRAVVASGGTVGVTMVPAFITKEPREATLARLIDHIDHIASLVGTENIAIGPDYVNFLEAWANRAETSPLSGLENISVLPNLTAALVQRGYSEAAIRGILGENFLRVLTGVIG